MLKFSVLVVDDEPDILKVIDGILSKLYTIKLCHSLLEAQDIIRSNNFDLIITDTITPESGVHLITGFNLALIAKAKGMKTIIMSGSYIENKPSYVDAIIYKPFFTKQILGIIEETL